MKKKDFKKIALFGILAFAGYSFWKSQQESSTNEELEDIEEGLTDEDPTDTGSYGGLHQDQQSQYAELQQIQDQGSFVVVTDPGVDTGYPTDPNPDLYYMNGVRSHHPIQHDYYRPFRPYNPVTRRHVRQVNWTV